jgi:transcriptional regulator with XRE-family HTH domain
MNEFIGKHNTQFGNYLRYWRNAKNISQEHLAHELDCSVKHVSFLENNRTQPSQALIMRLAASLGLSKVDTNSLLISAGFRAERGFLENSPDEKDLLDRSLSLLLENIGESPALIRNRFGDIKMMNKACVVLWREWLGESMDDPTLMNTYRLFFSPEGWRPHVEWWEQLAVILLMTLHQERLLSPDEEADALIDELSRVEGVPKDWAKMENAHTKRSSFYISLRDKRSKGTIDSLVCTSTIGNLSQNVDSSLSLEVHCHVNREPPYSASEIANMKNVAHPLLAY